MLLKDNKFNLIDSNESDDYHVIPLKEFIELFPNLQVISLS